ncbi:MAG TPA: ATP-dependent zinc metalloprotease FtsH [Polyangiaceae bacterium]|nr:ATP-dependent zinc metalloprotease FtsH [Polyangiaceae bacterium]
MSPTSSPAGKPAGARPSGPPPPPSARRWVPLLLVLTGLAGVEYVMARRSHEAEISYSEFYRDVGAGEVASVVFDGRDVTGHFTKPKTASGRSVSAFETSLPEVEDPGLLALLRDKGVDVKAYRDQDPLVVRVLAPLLPWVIIIGAWVWLSRRTQSMMSSGGPFAGLTRGKAKRFDLEPHVRVTFQDVAGLAPAKRDLQEIVDFLRDSERFRKLGGHIPRGVLLVGPPGTGKTLLARAVAGEAGAPFFSVNGSEFIELFVGVGAARVRELFDEAKKVAPAIIFIDEIDAVGRSRGAGLGGGNDEREQTLNQLLSAMDGFSRNDMIIVLAATNRPDVLDAALLRPGRFDRRVLVDRPELTARQAILGVHLRGKPLAADVDLKKIAATTPGFSGADLENLVNEAALNATRRQADAVAAVDFVAAYDKIVLGDPRETALSEDEKRRVAVHESGHTVVAYFTPGAERLDRVSILPRGMALGVTHQVPEGDRHLMTRTEIDARLRVLMGGLAAESSVLGEPSSGAEHDLKAATDLAFDMVAHFGMSDALGPVYHQHRTEHAFLGQTVATEGATSDATVHAIEKEVQRVLSEAAAAATQTIGSHRPAFDRLVATLIEHETVEREQLQGILGEAKQAASAA